MASNIPLLKKRQLIKEKHIKREYELLKFLTENNMELVWEFDTEIGEGLCIYNDGKYRAQKITNIYNYYLKYVFPEDIKKVEEEIRAIIEGKKESFVVEFRRKLNDEKYDWVSSKGKVVKGSYAENKRIIRGSEKRITDTKIAEENYEVTMANFESVLENTEHGIWAINKNYELIFLNSYSFRRYEEITGIKAKVGINVNRLSDSETSKFYKVYYDRALAGEKVSYDVAYSENGENKVLNISLNPIIRDGEVFGVSAIARNMTLEREKERELLEAKKVLIEKNSDKDRFISIIAHDLKGPIGTMIPVIKLLRDEAEKNGNDFLSNMAGYLNRISETTYKLLEDLLYWAKLQRGEISCNTEKIEIHKMIIEIIEMFGIIAENKKIAIVDEIGNEFQIEADIQMTKAIMRNIISNAIKFTEKEGKIIIRVYCYNENNIIEVEDNGIGISEERIEKLFKISEISSTKGTDGEKGTGLGLVMCREFMDKQGGKIEIESKIGKGTKLKMFFPKKIK